MAENKGFTNDGEDLPNSGSMELSQPKGNAAPVVEDAPREQSFREVCVTFPKSIFFIVGNEFCERFSFYGMRAVLTLYLLNVLGLSDRDSTAAFHAFTVVAYFTPILGSILADGFIGKFHTILWISLLYASGNILLAVAATYPKGQGGKIHPALDVVGLLVIAIGTGGIKPCVSAFGGDQFHHGQEKALEYFFSVFYFSINAGSFLSMIITPIMRDMSCSIGDRFLPSCYALCFGIPAVLMIVACLFFIIGSRWYKRYPPTENIFLEVFKAIATALTNKGRFSIKRDHWLDHYMDDHSCDWDPKCKASKTGCTKTALTNNGRFSIKRNHWLDHYMDDHSCDWDPKCKASKTGCTKAKFLEDIRAVGRVMILYLPVPFFWALFDQQGSRWLIQGTQMNGKTGSVQILPDQLQVANPVLIMIFIPIFAGIIYPVFGKCFKVTPLRKMTVGGILAVLAYVITAVVQFKINPTLPEIPPSGLASVHVVNYMPCNVTANVLVSGKTMTQELGPFVFGADPASYKFGKGDQDPLNAGQTTFDIISSKPSDPKCRSLNFTANTKSGSAHYLAVTPENYVFAPSDLKKPENGFGEYKIAFNMLVPGYDRAKIALCSPPSGDTKECYDANFQTKDRYFEQYWKSTNDTSRNVSGDYTQYFTVRPYDWMILLPTKPEDGTNVSYFGKVNVTDQGAIYTITFMGNSENPADWYDDRFMLVAPNKVPLLWQIPQFMVITAAEILFSITGLELSYSQAPPSMKSLLQGLWLLGVAIGDCIILIVVETDRFPNQAWEFVLFAAVMAVVILIFALIAQFRYHYVYYIHDEEEEREEQSNP